MSPPATTMNFTCGCHPLPFMRLMSQVRWAVVAAPLMIVACAHAQYTVHYLHPPGFSSSHVYDCYNGQLVGAAEARGIVWPSVSSAPINVTPPTHGATVLFGTDGVRQVGQTAAPGNGIHAAIWSGSTAYIDLHPGNAPTSFAYQIKGDWQVGATWPGPPTSSRAALWNNTAGSHVDLHPVGFSNTSAFCLDGPYQFGQGSSPAWHNVERPIRWSGTAASWVDFTPPGGDRGSIAEARQGVQVGQVRMNFTTWEAGLWSGTPESFVRLHPQGPASSNANSVANGRQVGRATFAGSISHAALWHGSSASFVDLHNFLGPNYNQSVANCIDPVTNIVGGVAFNTAIGRWEAVAWIINEDAVGPTAFAVIQGQLVSGGLNDLLESDDAYVRAKPFYNVPRSVPPLQIEFESTSPELNPMSIEFVIEAGADSGGGEQSIALFNYDSNTYETVDTRSTSATDAAVRAVRVTNAAKYVHDSNGQIKAKIMFVPPG